jgi:hypothetical protein
MVKELPPPIADLLKESRLPELGAGHADLSKRGELEGRIPEALRASGSMVNEEMARACMAGLWLHFDFLDDSHRISQQIDSPEGSYWHGVMHRREGDFANASYWFRRAGDLPFFSELGKEAAQLLTGLHADHPELARLAKGGPWDPYRFVDICKACIKSIPAIEEPCKKLQFLEWRHLFDHTFAKITNGNSTAQKG